jgi:electron transfer flavoprotein alpha subunit
VSTGAGDIAAGGLGRESGRGPAGAVVRGGLLVVVEPPGPGGEAGAAVFVAEGGRIARALGVAARFVTWPEDPDLDLDALAAALARLAEKAAPLAVLLADTDIGRQLAPMVAHRLGTGSVLGCSDVRLRSGDSRIEPGAGLSAQRQAGPGSEPVLTFVKPVYGGWLEREVQAEEGFPIVATLDAAALGAPPAPPETPPSPELLEIGAGGTGKIHRLELLPPDFRSVDLTHAERIVTAGSGGTGSALLIAVQELAELLEGSVGATRPVVDDGLLSKERLIGQTGKTVSPKLYLALGLSGSPHHLAGIRGAERVIAINRDAHAPIFQFSDVGYVADLDEILPALVNKIKEWRDVPGSPSKS